MKTISQAFEEFTQSLELTQAQRDEAIDQHTNMRAKLGERLDVAGNFLSGSYARNTAIRPLNDIDIFLVLNPGDELTVVSKPQEALTVVKDTLARIYPGKTPTLQSRSVNIEFSRTGIAYDVVPGFADPDDGEVYWIPDCDGPKWIKTNPRIHKVQSTRANEAAGKKLKPLLKSVKHANHVHGKMARSFHLEVLSWSILTTDPRSYLAGLVTLFAGLRDRIMDPCPDPAGLGPDIRPPREKLEATKKWLSEMATLASDAKLLADQGRTGEAHAKLRELFADQWPEKGSSGKGSGVAVVSGGAVDDSRSRFG